MINMNDDLIYRQDVVKLVKNSYYNLGESIKDTFAMLREVEELPSAEPKRKKYRHFKGGLYEVICEAEPTENMGTLVIYRNIETGLIWARPYEKFHGYTEDGKKRFEEVDE